MQGHGCPCLSAFLINKKGWLERFAEPDISRSENDLEWYDMFILFGLI
ncbi:hypothetical protein VA7868_00430 [Vibrio aerogenes CECT 7868]|uniref:Uncharacterized protein n=1 Tax=Vibrio aerogenes CECT 7868 TaxID=1216006 RepID=A0A1M5VL32_9VIBR|nr:hypothetical protein VA7868_00430 [Vibrio aerogenes CECT 7868]